MEFTDICHYFGTYHKNLRMKRILPSVILTLILSASNHIFAQKTFEPGYLITEKKDTLRGLINYKNWSKNPESISFKSGQEGKIETYEIDDLAGFFVHGETYIKAEVAIDAGPSKDEDMTYSPTPQIGKAIAFLLVINDGTKGFYYLKDKENKVQLYVRNKPGNYELLINHKYRINDGGKIGIVTQNRFRQQLATLFSDCEELTKTIVALTYSEHAIGKLFETYYTKCSSEKQIVAYQPEGFIFQPAIVAGLSSSVLDFKGSFDPEVIDGNFPRSTNFAGGISLNIIAPRLQRRFSIYNELLFTSYKTTLINEIYTNENYYRKYYYTMGYRYIKLINMVRFQFPAGNSKVFLNLGFSNGLAISETNEKKI